MSAGANGRDWWSMPVEQRRRIDPTSDYVSADTQIFNTTGVHMSPNGVNVREADDATTRKVIKAFDRRRKVGTAAIESDGENGHVGREPNSDDFLPKFEEGSPIPSMGEESDDCDEEILFFCDSCAETYLGGRTCGLSGCPRCWSSWVRDSAVKHAEKLMVTRAVRDKNLDEQQFFHHLAWSVPDEWALQADEPYKKTKQAINEVLDAMGLDGRVYYHAWRGADENADGEEIENDLGEWKDRVGEDTTWPEVRENLEFSPHFHVIAVGHKVPGGDLTKRVEEETGWSLHRITKGEDSKVSLFNNSDMVSALLYCLSHTSLNRTAADRNRVKSWSHGPILNQKIRREDKIDDEDEWDGLIIRQETHDEVDLLARGHAQLTLGVELESQICTEEFDFDPGRETGAERAGVKTLIDLGTGDTREWTPSGPTELSTQSRTELPTSQSERAGELSSDSDLPAVSGATVSEVEEIDHDREGECDHDEDDSPDTEVCQGRMLPIWEAESYLGDEEFREQAENIHELDAAWTTWKPRLNEMLDNFGPG